jgi:hypothetical protein
MYLIIISQPLWPREVPWEKAQPLAKSFQSPYTLFLAYSKISPPVLQLQVSHVTLQSHRAPAPFLFYWIVSVSSLHSLAALILCSKHRGLLRPVPWGAIHVFFGPIQLWLALPSLLILVTAIFWLFQLLILSSPFLTLLSSMHRSSMLPQALTFIAPSAFGLLRSAMVLWV